MTSTSDEAARADEDVSPEHAVELEAPKGEGEEAMAIEETNAATEGEDDALDMEDSDDEPRQQPGNDSDDGPGKEPSSASMHLVAKNHLRNRQLGSPAESLASLPHETVSIRGSMLSSPGSSILPSREVPAGYSSPTPSLRPFDRRFSSRLSYSPANRSRAASPAFLNSHSRNVSLGSRITLDDPNDTPSPPWEVVRWTRLKKLNAQVFSESGRRNFGSPTCMAVSTNIFLGMSKGIILIFDSSQGLKSVVGLGTRAIECGSITSIAMSADHICIAGGHANGDVFVWDTTKPAKPFLYVPSLTVAQLSPRNLDGHVPDTAVTHLGFLGTRHTALVSADERGMAFSHLASRGTGVLGRSVRTTRILGRYPETSTMLDKPRKPSTILAFASLPLGNIERGVDDLGLTAMLTPYLLVIVSTTPIAQTQHKAARPKEVQEHGAMSGCLAWFPAVKLKVPDPPTGDVVSKVKLVYCWSNVLTVLDVDEITAEDKDKPPSLSFKARSRWKSEEAIVAVQWLSRSVLAVLTITQRLIILEDRTMRLTEGFDLIQKQIFHKDLFSKQLHSLVEQLDDEDSSMHGVVADAFYMSVKAYKGRIFLLGFSDISIGTLSNWADRLVALMEEGDYVAAILLAKSYYTGDADKLTIGLPEDAGLRHDMVRDKLLEIMKASLEYTFGLRNTGKAESEVVQRALVEACFETCMNIQDLEFLFDEVFAWFEAGNVAGLFLETLEPFILSREISLIPPMVVKALVAHYVAAGHEGRLEEMICQMQTATLDLDEITTLCKRHHLYDALIYVWNEALMDYVAPLIDLLSLLMPHDQNSGYFSAGGSTDVDRLGTNALKIFPYLSYTFTGRRYPSGNAMGDHDATRAKAEIYWFLFSGKIVVWPPRSGRKILPVFDATDETSFPYLRMILQFDAPSFLSVLNEAFEDPFLNDSSEHDLVVVPTLSEEQEFGRSMTRQHIVRILLEVMNPKDFAAKDTVYLDMFIARNLPKFPQYLLFSGSILQDVLVGLCRYPSDDVQADAQLSVEYLMSVYRPSDISSLIPMFREARFFRVLKSIYRVERQYDMLLKTYFEDRNDRHEVFDAIAFSLNPQLKMPEQQLTGIYHVLEEHALDLIGLDVANTAQTIDRYAPSLHDQFILALGNAPELQYEYLRNVLDPALGTDFEVTTATRQDQALVERYVRLMCKFDKNHVADYVASIQASDLRLDQVLPSMEDTGAIDAAVILMTRDGLVHDAMVRLVAHLGTMEAALLGIFDTLNNEMDPDTVKQTAEDLLEGLQKYTGIGIWLCTSTDTIGRRSSNTSWRKSAKKENLSTNELLWLELIEATVRITRGVSSGISSFSAVARHGDFAIDTEPFSNTLRTLVQRTFTALLTATSQSDSVALSTTSTTNTQSLSFLRILRAFLTRASLSSPNLRELRAVLGSIFAAYAYEESILALANRLLDKTLFVTMEEANAHRLRGWRPRGAVCEACKRRVWGPGVGGDIWRKWEDRERQDCRRVRERSLLAAQAFSGDSGKGVEYDASDGADEETTKMGRKDDNHGGTQVVGSGDDDEDGKHDSSVSGTGLDLGPLVVLACRHIYHRSCLEKAQPVLIPGGGNLHSEREFRCPIDG